jgi:hypothetical protein
MRERCGAISRRNTSLPPPGLEWVATLSVCVGYRACADAFSVRLITPPAIKRRHVTTGAEVLRPMIGESTSDHWTSDQEVLRTSHQTKVSLPRPI